MKFLCYSFFLLAISNGLLANHVEENTMVNGASDIIGSIIRGLLDKIRTAVPDPVKISGVNITLNNPELASGFFFLKGFQENGLKDFNLSQISVAVLKSSLGTIITIPSINLNLKYDSRLLAGTVLPIYGKGPINVNIEQLAFNLTSKYALKLLPPSMQLKNVSFIITMESATFDLHGLIDNEAFSVLLGQILNDNVAKFVNTRSHVLSRILSPIIEKVVNAALNPRKRSHPKNGFSEEELGEINEIWLNEFRKLTNGIDIEFV